MKLNLRNFLVLFLSVMGASVSWAEGINFNTGNVPQGSIHKITWNAVPGATYYQVTLKYYDANGDKQTKVLDPQTTLGYENNDLAIASGSFVQASTDGDGYGKKTYATFTQRVVYYYGSNDATVAWHYYATNINYASGYIPVGDKTFNRKSQTVTMPVRDGYTCVGWTTNPSGVGDPVQLPLELTEENTSLYAIWEGPVSQKSSDVTTNIAGWATYTNCDPQKRNVVLIPNEDDTKKGLEPVKAYMANCFTYGTKTGTAPEVNNTKRVIMTPVTVIPYGEGVFIKGQKRTTYQINYTDAAADNFDGNLIVGVYGEEESITKWNDYIEKNPGTGKWGTWLDAGSCAYVIMTDYDNDRCGIYKVTDDCFVPSEHAYLSAADEKYEDTFQEGELLAKGAIVLDLDAETTGIENVVTETNTQANVYHNIAGQIVSKDFKGIVIDAAGNKFINK